MSETPTTEPTIFTAGDTVAWEISLADYPASTGWTLKYRLLSLAGKLDITSTANGDKHAVSISAVTSATYPPGDYQFQKYVEQGSGAGLIRHTLVGGTITIAPDLSAAAVPTDTRTFNKKMLDAIDAVLEGTASQAELQTETTIDGTTVRLQYAPREKLQEMRGVYGYKVYRENNPGKIGPSVNISFGGIR